MLQVEKKTTVENLVGLEKNFVTKAEVHGVSELGESGCNQVESCTDSGRHLCKCDLCLRRSEKLKSLITVQITGHCNSSVHNHQNLISTLI